MTQVAKIGQQFTKLLEIELGTVPGAHVQVKRNSTDSGDVVDLAYNPGRLSFPNHMTHDELLRVSGSLSSAGLSPKVEEGGLRLSVPDDEISLKKLQVATGFAVDRKFEAMTKEHIADMHVVASSAGISQEDAMRKIADVLGAATPGVRRSSPLTARSGGGRNA